ncbi:hypothetical protein [Sneathiella chinensis]|uniref:Phasin domain-containing protein n=1 Tax=Sneathiella chinensis TaxID=349750 RepID=A0ABQ5U4W3_9PROT|nr:hypothetical protein [Sneathiella chinensis]GLQ06235.1 hypothetical protein GCM10007924_14560 [Sneathiella chinensis]
MTEETEAGPAAGATGAAPAVGGPTMAGKMLVPDMTPFTIDQTANLQKMVEANQFMSAGLQEIVAAQREALQSILKGFETDLQSSRSAAGQPAGTLPGLDPQLTAFAAAMDNFGATATGFNAATTRNFETLGQSITASLAKIEEVAIKFSGG